MDKSEERAFEKYPICEEEPQDGSTDAVRIAYVAGYKQALEDMNLVVMKSPFTGGAVVLENRTEEIGYRGEKFNIRRYFYRCKDTGREFTTTDLDSDMMWALFRAYWEKKGFEHFYDIDHYKEKKYED